MPNPPLQGTGQKIIPGPILAIRGWGTTERNEKTYLTGLGYHTPWEPTLAPAMDAIPSDSDIHAHCPCEREDRHCGYWGLRWREDIPAEATVHGIVALWGKVVAHERGWRAEYAYPVLLWNKKRKPETPPSGFPGFAPEWVGQQGEYVRRQLERIGESDAERAARTYNVPFLQYAPDLQAGAPHSPMAGPGRNVICRAVNYHTRGGVWCFGVAMLVTPVVLIGFWSWLSG